MLNYFKNTTLVCYHTYILLKYFKLKSVAWEVTVLNVAVKLQHVGTTQNSLCHRNGLKTALSTLLMGVICTLPLSDTEIILSYLIPSKYDQGNVVHHFDFILVKYTI